MLREFSFRALLRYVFRRQSIGCCMPLLQVLQARGYAASVMTGRSMDAAGEPLPWYSYPAIDYIRGLDLRDKTVFEFGGGFSTLFWASRARSVSTVESNREWHGKLASHIPPNVNLVLREDEPGYLGVLRESLALFDIIVVDGDANVVNRRKMAEVALKKCASGGFIILDNSDCHVKAAQVLRDADLLQVDMAGFAPCSTVEQTTSFFFDRHCHLKPREKWQPVKSPGSMRHYVEE
ncbi:MAG: hypothetical protein WCV00_22725 [Verrucomicrobiia bacterium]